MTTTEQTRPSAGGSVGERLRHARYVAGLTTLALSRSASVARGTIADIESGRTASLRATTAKALADALGIPVAVLIPSDTDALA